MGERSNFAHADVIAKPIDVEFDTPLADSYTQTMEWTDSTQQRFNQLRDKGLFGHLSMAEQNEFDSLVGFLEENEARYLRPYLARLGQETEAAEAEIARLQAENEALARVVAQQEKLIADAKRWLADFEQRHVQIQENYLRITERVLQPA